MKFIFLSSLFVVAKQAGKARMIFKNEANLAEKSRVEK
jgi:hypothetical protein